MSTTTNLQLPHIMPAQAQKHVTHNEALQILDMLVQGVAESRTINTQPGSPADGATWILPSGKTGSAWDNFGDHKLAYFTDGIWSERQPSEGWRLWVRDEARLYVYRQGAWTPAPDLVVQGGLTINHSPVTGVTTLGLDAITARNYTSSLTPTIASNSVAEVPTAQAGGFAFIVANGGPTSSVPQLPKSGIVMFDAGITPAAQLIGGGSGFNAVSYEPTGTSGPSGEVTVGVKTGKLVIENRDVNPYPFSVTFLG